MLSLFQQLKRKKFLQRTDTMSSFSSLTVEQKQLLYVTIVLNVLESNHQLLLMIPSIHQKLLVEPLQHPAGS